MTLNRIYTSYKNKSTFYSINNKLFSYVLLFILSFLIINNKTIAAEVFSAKDVLHTKTCSDVEISPDGTLIAYTVRVDRGPNDEAGGAYQELYIVSVPTGTVQPFITGKVNINTPRWSPDGSKIAFLTKRGEGAKTQIWMISIKGGEAVQITHSETAVSDFRWHPAGDKIAYIATTPATNRELILEKKGYGFIFYEENLKHRNLCMIKVDSFNEKNREEQLTDGVTVWSFEFSPNGKTIAAAISEKNLIDQRYMFQKINLLNLETKELRQLTNNPGKLGNFKFSPDGTRLAYTAARERKDHAVSQVYIIDIDGKNFKNLTIPDFQGHVNWVGWKDNNTVIYKSGEGVWTTLSLVNIVGEDREIILHSQKTGVIFSPPSYTKDFKHATMIGESPNIPGDVYHWEQGKKLNRLTNLNPWITNRKLGRQEVIHYQARDSLEIEGLLIYPVDFQQDQRYPLIVVVHGGPESNYSNEWLTSYSKPGQVLAGKGYIVFYPNYRASTGYGVDYALQGYEDPAGKEFDDIADGIDYLIRQEIVDPDRVGLMGGSYGGYAAAWFSSYYTKYVKAVCMFVGISDLISKRGTTDIPYEELYVHSGKKLEEMWDLSLKRSPIFWAHQSQTAVLILGGTDDTRVHPSQSLEYYRCLKMNNHPAVRLVQYPGEEHGNEKQPGRIDFLYRTLQWMDWYVKDRKQLEGQMPPLDISEQYGLELED